jgi:hypothetical protein
MKKFLLFPLLILFCFSGCTIEKNGSDLTGFILRMNERNESYNLTANGFLYDDNDEVLYKFFAFTDTEILLSFKEDTKGRLTEMNIVADKDFHKDEAVIKFIENTLFSFIDNEELTNNILTETDFFNSIKTINNDTKKAENGNIEILLDVTEIGTVITVYKDI